MKSFAELCEAVAKTTKKTIKVGHVSQYFHEHPVAENVLAALFLSGKAFPAHTETTLNVGGSLIWQTLEKITGQSSGTMNAAYRRYGDLGSAAGDLLALQDENGNGDPLPLAQVEETFQQLARARTQAARLALIEQLLRRATPLEAKYLVKIMTGDLRIGLRESLVEDAIAAAYGEDPALVRRANMLLGDIGETLRLAAQHRLNEARMRLFHPIAMMLASPVESAEEAIQYFEKALVEDKYDGIRAQAHIGQADEQPRIFSRTLDEVTNSFPELAHALRRVKERCILDGEVVAWKGGRAMPFSDLQQRLGRKEPAPELMRQVPVAYVAFDVLHAHDEFLIDRPLAERRQILERLFAGLAPESAFDPDRASKPQAQLFSLAPESAPIYPAILASPVRQATTAQELDVYFAEAQARGNEGLMIKDVASAYAPGRRGKWWLKIKRELATLDVVVTAVEYGHGKRAGVLSDYTFAVRDPESDELLNIGKAYSGLTDVEIAANTEWFLEHTIADEGWRRVVEPKMVLEVAFNNMMKSDRHESGYALRFPRILRIRTDKSPDEIDTLERAREIYEGQFKK
jgi:DNA ligase 1